jgi:hypothetical protein
MVPSLLCGYCRENYLKGGLMAISECVGGRPVRGRRLGSRKQNRFADRVIAGMLDAILTGPHDVAVPAGPGSA